jgi:DNA-binding NarL/FixJ family response regulator
MTDVIDIAAVDDHPIILDAIAGWVMAADSGIRVIATAATVDALLAGDGRHAHVVLLDLDLADGTTAERNVAAIRQAGPAVLVLSVRARGVQRQRNWSCTIEPSRTGTSPHSHSHDPPPW